MSPRKLTEDDKKEILKLYRNSEATTSTLANDYEVSSSTISRFLKNKLSSTEYEDLIQQKRLARTPRGEKKSTTKSQKTNNTKKTKTKIQSKTTRKKSEKTTADVGVAAVETPSVDISASEAKGSTIETKSKSKTTTRRRRRRASQTEEKQPLEAIVETAVVELDETETEATDKSKKLVIDKQPSSTETSASSKLILKSDRVDDDDEDDDDDNDVDLVVLKEMLGEDLEDFNDEDDEEDDDWEDDNEEGIDFSAPASLSDIEILPLSQASLPRTCYLVIDRSAELIVKPLADFADLGAIPQEEIKQRTLPVFDNHRIAKRFSHRRERVIKVPDGRMIQKTSQHLQEKGITRLLIDGQIYSLAH